MGDGRGSATGGVDAVDGVDADGGVPLGNYSSHAKLRVTHQGTGVKARWRFDAIVTYNVNEH